MIGFIVKHNGEGLGKIRFIQGSRITVDFFDPPKTATLVAVIDGRKVLKHALLPLNTNCTSPIGKCRIAQIIRVSNKIDPHRYLVEFENGLSQELSEVDLVPSGRIPASNLPLDVSGELRVEGYETFQKREALAEAWQSTLRGGFGLRALLSSRIDLRSHQAYVAGTVLMDRLPRFILADEVGLGKTIEAGIVIHDLMSRKLNAKILILCPASLSQQWLCELYAKFSGRVFKMLELRRRCASAGIIPDQTIASFPAALKHSSVLQQNRWDMVVVDEVHNIIGSPRLYSLVKKLSVSSPGCLLLSAIPAQHREEEYLRLLALLEPQRYKPEDPQAKAHFKGLYDQQIELSRKLSYISRKLAEFRCGDETADPVIKKIAELAVLPVLSLDESLANSAKALDPLNPNFDESVHDLLHHVGDRYRISRRILRNRRSQLVESQSDLQITRRLCRLPYRSVQLEVDAWGAVRNLLRALKGADISDSVLLPLAKFLFQSLCDPSCLKSFVGLASSLAPELADHLEFDGQVSYDGWDEYAATLWGAARHKLADKDLQEIERVADVWMSGVDGLSRIEVLEKFLRARHREAPMRKFLIFAGFPGLATRLIKELEKDFPSASLARFVWNMDGKLKEKEVLRFARNSECWLMVSDETGGEGRNFQFVDEIIHYDLPWHVSKVEQRIGRLDRLGRKHLDVCSNVVFAEAEEEDGLLQCYDAGFQVFTRSISGLEFALSHLEGSIAEVAVSEGFDGMSQLVGQIRQGAERERAGDENQGILDAASLERKIAEVFRRAQSTPERDLALESAFCDYFRFIAGNGSLRERSADDHPEGIIEFRPDQFRELDGLLPATATGTHADRLGTFRRQIAQERPDLEFFSVGNNFFDAVCSTLRSSSGGQAYAVECLDLSRDQWCGFEFAYRAVGSCETLAKHPGLVKHLDRILSIRSAHIFVSDGGQLPEDGAALLNIRRKLKREDKERNWWNFTVNNNRVQLLASRYGAAKWQELVNRLEQISCKQAKKIFSEALAPAIEAEQSRIAEQIRQAKVSKSDGWEEEIAGFEALCQAINGWEIELEAAGFLSVNGGLIS